MKRNIKKVIKTKPKRIGRGTVEKRPVVNRKSVPLKNSEEPKQRVTPKKAKVKPNKVTTKFNKSDGVKRSARPFSKINPIYKGDTVYLVGGGPSLSTFNWDSLRDKSVIAINKSYQYVPFAKVIFWTDSRFYTWYHNELQKLTVDKYTITNSIHYDDSVKLLKKGKRHGLERGDSIISHGDNSGYAAINLAYHLGAAKIVLLGYDMGGNGKSHFHDGYPVKETSDHIYQNRFIPAFPHIAKDLKAEGIPVYNTSKVSPLTCFPKISIEESLRL